MPDQREGKLGEAVTRLVLLAACLLAVWSVMDGWSWSLARLTTSGCEEEGLFPIWKFARGETVYAAARALPFSISYFNWLFFLVYGGAVKVCLALFALDDGAVPAIARLVTLGFATASVTIVYAILGMLNPARLADSRLGRLACSLFVIVNPLTGTWLFTTRPDIAATTCELFGLWCALRFAETRRLGPLLGAVLAGYAAWSFKQNYVHLMGGLGMFLLLRRQWRELALVVLVFVALTGGTLLLGGVEYRNAVIRSQAHCRVSLAAAVEILRRAAGSAPQLVAVAVALVAGPVLRKRWPASASRDLLAGTAMVGLMLGFLGSAKQGADINYFIPASIFGMVWGLSLFPRSDENFAGAGRMPVVFRWAIVALFGLAIVNELRPPVRKAAAELAQLFGRGEMGRNEVATGIGQELSQLRRHLAELPGPVFVTDRACNLPWIQTKAPHCVYAFTYALDRKAGKDFEGGGIGGLIEKGYFETIVVLRRGCACETPGLAPSQCIHVTMNHLPLVQDAAVPSIDGGRLNHYRLAFQDGAFTYYRKHQP